MYREAMTLLLCIAVMFEGVNVWRIAKSKLVGEKKFGKWIDPSIKVVRYKKKLNLFIW